MLTKVLRTFSFSFDNMSIEDSDFCHEEADISMVSHVLNAAASGKHVIRVISDDTDVFVLLVFWVYQNNLQCKVQMQHWDGSILDINATCHELGFKCLQLLGVHALSGCDTTSYPFKKGKLTAIKVLKNGNFQGLYDVLGNVDANKDELLEAGKAFFLALYRQPSDISMEMARFLIYTKNKKSPEIMSLSPTSENPWFHILRTH